MSPYSLQHDRRADRALLLALGALARLTGQYRPVVLRYHSIDPSRSRLSVSRENFAAQMDYLARAGFAVVPLAEAVAGGGKRRRVALTFDDGYRNNLAEAVPILEAHGFPVTFYIAPLLLDTLPRWAAPDQDGLRIMSHGELCELAARPGVTIGAHTLTHRRLDTLDADAAGDEIRGAKRELAALLGGEIDSFCYPHGAYTRETVALVRKWGYRSACTVAPGTALRLKSLFEICRVYVAPTMTLSEFAAALTVASDWRLAVRGEFRKVMTRVSDK
ncbi:MAG: polysaccharide deacetylase family protein [Chloroflexi bacterium]|nr:polysaccharide deacetylase family protein [Chloroflexota bacterium]